MLTAPPSLSLPPAAVWLSPPSASSWGTTHGPEPTPKQPQGNGGDGSCHSLPLPPVLAVTSNDLTYRGEGADHVVLGLRKLGKVLRLRKTSVGACPSREELVSRATRDQEVLSRVGRALLGRLLTDAAHLVLVAPRPDSALSDALLPWRREHRQGKINSHGIACICSDATTIFIPRHDNSPAPQAVTNHPMAPIPSRGVGTGEGTAREVDQQYPKEASTVCIEIKPKQGFLDHSTPGLPLCRYCVKQFFKAGKESGSRSGYCPLDLFSGNLDRMRRAVDNLFLSPQNNFKVFVDGQPREETQPFHYLRDIIIAALTFDFTSGRATATSGKLSERSPLGRILAFQGLDRLGVFRASQFYLTLCDLLGSPEAVDRALNDLSAWPSPALDLLSSPVEEEEEEEEVMMMVRLLQSYLLSTTAKDLSLMILLSGPHYSPVPQFLPNTSPFIVEGTGGVWFRCQVTGVDIVAKPTSKILKHQRDYEQLRDVLAELRTRREEPPCCRL